MNSDLTLPPSRHFLLGPARLAFLLLGGLVALVLVAYVPQSIDGMYTDWQVLSSYPAMKSLLPFQAYATTVWSLRYLTVVIFWLAAVLIYVEVGLRNTSFTWMGLYTALLLACLPPALLTGQAGAQPAFPAPWDAILSITSMLIAVLGLVGTVFFYYIFPDGSFGLAGCAGSP